MRNSNPFSATRRPAAPKRSPPAHERSKGCYLRIFPLPVSKLWHHHSMPAAACQPPLSKTAPRRPVRKAKARRGFAPRAPTGPTPQARLRRPRRGLRLQGAAAPATRVLSFGGNAFCFFPRCRRPLRHGFAAPAPCGGRTNRVPQGLFSALARVIFLPLPAPKSRPADRPRPGRIRRSGGRGNIAACGATPRGCPPPCPAPAARGRIMRRASLERRRRAAAPWRRSASFPARRWGCDSPAAARRPWSCR